MLRAALTDFFHLFFPNVCVLCGQPLVSGEREVCLQCLTGQPHTGFALRPDNPMEQLFWGRAEAVRRAAALFYFEKGSQAQRLIHLVKYHGHTELGRALGRYAAHDTQGSPLAGADVIVPVPLHPKRLRARGYNQSELIAEGLAEVWGLPVDGTGLRRARFNLTQTRKGVYERWENADGIFEVTDPARYQGKTVLLVDDVATTGATLCAAAQALGAVPGTRVYCFCLAIAR